MCGYKSRFFKAFFFQELLILSNIVIYYSLQNINSPTISGFLILVLYVYSRNSEQRFNILLISILLHHNAPVNTNTASKVVSSANKPSIINPPMIEKITNISCFVEGHSVLNKGYNSIQINRYYCDQKLESIFGYNENNKTIKTTKPMRLSWFWMNNINNQNYKNS